MTQEIRYIPCPHISSSDEGTQSCDLAMAMALKYYTLNEKLEWMTLEGNALASEVVGLRMSHENSKVVHCYIKKRQNDPAPWLFQAAPNGPIVACLDGYAVIPREEYDALCRTPLAP